MVCRREVHPKESQNRIKHPSPGNPDTKLGQVVSKITYLYPLSQDQYSSPPTSHRVLCLEHLRQISFCYSFYWIKIHTFRGSKGRRDW